MNINSHSLAIVNMEVIEHNYTSSIIAATIWSAKYINDEHALTWKDNFFRMAWLGICGVVVNIANMYEKKCNIKINVTWKRRFASSSYFMIIDV